MKLKFLSVLALVSLTGCGDLNRASAQFTGYSTICVQGVKYVQLASGASVMYDTSGKIKTCK